MLVSRRPKSQPRQTLYYRSDFPESYLTQSPIMTNSSMKKDRHVRTHPMKIPSSTAGLWSCGCRWNCGMPENIAWLPLTILWWRCAWCARYCDALKTKSRPPWARVFVSFLNFLLDFIQPDWIGERSRACARVLEKKIKRASHQTTAYPSIVMKL